MGTILVPLFAHYRPAAPLVQAAYAEGLQRSLNLTLSRKVAAWVDVKRSSRITTAGVIIGAKAVKRACWASSLFLGNGLVAALNPASVLAHLAGAVSTVIAIFLILELSHPYMGLIRLSPDGIDRVLRFSPRPTGKRRRD